MPVASPSLLVVGGGLTGAAVGRALMRRGLPADNVVIWEALAHTGGRMHTERTSVLNTVGLADTGAQYVTITDDKTVAEAHKPLYSSLIEAGILAPMRGRIEGGRSADGGGANFVAPHGVSSIVDHLFAESALAPCCGRTATSLRLVAPSSDAARGRWEVSSLDGHREYFDGVVLTSPIPDALTLLDTGDGGTWLNGEGRVSRADLNAVQYSSRYALTLFFPPTTAAAFAANIDWAARYVTKAEDDAIVYISHDSAKRGDSKGAPSLVVHTSVPYGLHHIKNATPDDAVAAELRAKISSLLPWLPEPASVALKTWKVSQVRYPVALAEGSACLTLRPSHRLAPAPALVLAGDAFSPLGSRFDGCVQSGDQAAAAVLTALEYGQPS